MRRKNKAKNRRYRDMVPRPRRLTPIKIGIALGVVVLGAAVLLRPAPSGGGGNALTQGSNDLVSLGTLGGTGLPPPAPGTRSPINDTDPVTGKPITLSSPILDYKGYAIGFCCATSEGYRGAWNRMSEKEKDAFVRKYVK